MDESTASRVLVSYPAALSEWGRVQIGEESFRAYLGRTRDRAAPGDVWEEFVDVGCCGDTLDVTLRVESVDGGPALGPETAIEYVARDADEPGDDTAAADSREADTAAADSREDDHTGGWRVQSRAGPDDPPDDATGTRR